MNSSLSTKEKILYEFDIEDYKGIEIGPLANPLVNKDEGDVRYVDRASIDEIKNWYRKAKNLDLDKIVPIDYIWGDASLADATGHTNYFDYCIAAHVVEHVPDLIGWLQEISSILKVGGIASFSVPDRRFTFDFLRSETIVADIVEAYLQKRRKPSIRHIFDHFSNFAEIDVVEAWKPRFDGKGLVPKKTLDEVLTICEGYKEEDNYIDSHCWVFTEQSFLKILTALSELNLIDFRITRFFRVEENNHEFIIQLEKIDPLLAIEEKQALYNESLIKTCPHIFTVEFECKQSGLAQVYYDTGAGFNERESVNIEYSKSKSKITLEFELPSMGISAVRFDPIKDSVNFKIYSMSLRPFSKDAWALPYDMFEVGENISKGVVKKDFFYAKSKRKTTDPFISITLPRSLKGKL